jgi:hypothetical protein
VDSVGKVEKAHSDRNESNAWEKGGTSKFNCVKYDKGYIGIFLNFSASTSVPYQNSF